MYSNKAERADKEIVRLFQIEGKLFVLDGLNKNSSALSW